MGDVQAVATDEHAARDVGHAHGTVPLAPSARFREITVSSPAFGPEAVSPIERPGRRIS